MTINTAKVIGRRQLHFETFKDLRNDLNQLSQQSVKTLGNWSFAQILMHLAIGFRIPVEGGFDFNPPWYLKLLAPLVKNRMIYKPMSPGFKLPSSLVKDLVPPPSTNVDDAMHALRTAVDIYEATSEPHLQPHSIFGQLTREQWDQFNLRHAEMHLSFVVPA